MKKHLTILLFLTPVLLFAQPHIYWGDSETNDLRRANLDGSSLNPEILVTVQNTPRGMQIDPTNGHIYWVDGVNNQIRRANLDGTGETILVNSLTQPIDLALDLVNGYIYFSDNGIDGIFRVELDGSNETLILGNTVLNNPTSIAIDLSSNLLFWTDFDDNTLNSAFLDGINRKEILGNVRAASIGVDPINRQVYFPDRINQQVQKVSYDGSGRTDLIATTNEAKAIALDWDNGHIFWGEPENDKIRRINFDGSNPVDIYSNVPTIGEIALVNEAPSLAACARTHVIENVGDLLAIQDCQNIQGSLIFKNFIGSNEISLPNLEEVQGSFWVYNTGANTSDLINLQLPNLQFIGENINVISNDKLGELSLPRLVNSIGDLNIISNPQLLNVDIPFGVDFLGSPDLTINIYENDLLSACCFASPEKFNLSSTSFNIYDNAGTCEETALTGDVDNDDIPDVCDPCVTDPTNACESRELPAMPRAYQYFMIILFLGMGSYLIFR